MRSAANQQARRMESAGFTLIEVLVSLAIVSMVIAALGTLFARSGRVYTTQNATAALQQEVRAALDIITTEARVAAYNPTKAKPKISERIAIRSATATRFHFSTDLDENGKAAAAYNGDGECENRSFRFSLQNNGIQMLCGEGTGSPSSEFLIGGTNSAVRVVALDFAYRDKENNPTSLSSKIRNVIVTIVAEAPAGQRGMIRRAYTTSVDIRNAGPNT